MDPLALSSLPPRLESLTIYSSFGGNLQSCYERFDLLPPSLTELQLPLLAKGSPYAKIFEKVPQGIISLTLQQEGEEDLADQYFMDPIWEKP